MCHLVDGLGLFLYLLSGLIIGSLLYTSQYNILQVRLDTASVDSHHLLEYLVLCATQSLLTLSFTTLLSLSRNNYVYICT